MNRIFPILLILGAIAIFFFYVKPTYSSDIVPAQQQISDYDKALAASKTFAQKQNDLLTKRNAIPSADMDRLATFLPDDVDNIQLILDLTALAARTGVTLSDFSIQNESADATAAATVSGPGTSSGPGLGGTQVPNLGSGGLTNSATIGVTVTGSYSAFRQFLSAIELSLRQLDAVTVSVSPADGAKPDSFTLSLRVYWLK